jgi:hypothetical protein
LFVKDKKSYERRVRRIAEESLASSWCFFLLVNPNLMFLVCTTHSLLLLALDNSETFKLWALHVR